MCYLKHSIAKLMITSTVDDLTVYLVGILFYMKCFSSTDKLMRMFVRQRWDSQTNSVASQQRSRGSWVLWTNSGRWRLDCYWWPLRRDVGDRSPCDHVIIEYLHAFTSPDSFSERNIMFVSSASIIRKIKLLTFIFSLLSNEIFESEKCCL